MTTDCSLIKLQKSIVDKVTVEVRVTKFKLKVMVQGQGHHQPQDHFLGQGHGQDQGHGSRSGSWDMCPGHLWVAGIML